MDHQQVLVDQIGGHERTDQHAATHDHEVRARALLEVRHGGWNVAVQQGRVRPVEPRRRVARGDVLASVVERVLEWAARGVPGPQQIFVGAPPKQKCAIPAHPFAHLGDHRLVAARDRPAASLKPIPRVLVRAAWSLHHAVKRQLIHHDYFSHLISCPFDLGSAIQMPRLGILETRVVPASHPLHERDRPKSTSTPNWPLSKFRWGMPSTHTGRSGWDRGYRGGSKRIQKGGLSNPSRGSWIAEISS